MSASRPLARLSASSSSSLAACTRARAPRTPRLHRPVSSSSSSSRKLCDPAAPRYAAFAFQRAASVRGFSTSVARRDDSASYPCTNTTGSASGDAADAASSGAPPRDPPPSYELRFTCKRCSTKSAHRISKQGYHHGTVLVGCPGCKERHLISDHMKIFSDGSVTVEDLMARNGQHVKYGSLSDDGDLELWDDGTQTLRADAIKPVQRQQQKSQEGEQEEKPYGATFKGE